MARELTAAFDSLAERRLLMFGGKGGVGKTTLASLAALHAAADRDTILFSSDPASNLPEIFGGRIVERLTLDAQDGESLYRSYLDANLETFLELGDRGTYLDREELRRFFELAVPGIDELMSWIRIGDLVADHPAATVIVDSAPTGHTLRMLGSSRQFMRFGEALGAMQSKHRALVEQLTRRRSRDAVDDYLERFHADLQARLELIADPRRSAFIPVFLAEPWVTEQTANLTAEVRALGIDVPFLVLNRAVEGCPCRRCAERAAEERRARARLRDETIVRAPRSCLPIDGVDELRGYLRDRPETLPPGVTTSLNSAPALQIPGAARAVFVAGKGGVGKTTVASSLALQIARRSPDSGIVLISIDPAHGLREAFASIERPPNLEVELIDTAGQWNALRERIGRGIAEAIDSLTPRGIRLPHDAAVMEQLLDAAPPGADEILAIVRLHELLLEERRALVIIDTAPTGHFLRLLELPRSAGEWVREFIRILLRYRELVPPGPLAEQLVNASRALTAFDEFLHSPSCTSVVVTRPERIVISETGALISRLQQSGMSVAGVVANYLARPGDCRCDSLRRRAEEAALATLAEMQPALPIVTIEERHAPVTDASDLTALVPLVLTSG